LSLLQVQQYIAEFFRAALASFKLLLESSQAVHGIGSLMFCCVPLLEGGQALLLRLLAGGLEFVQLASPFLHLLLQAFAQIVLGIQLGIVVSLHPRR
jgi:hypothetical protein